MPSEPLLLEGRAALDRGEWDAARAAFEAALAEEETGEALFGLSDALWWLGETEDAVRYAERAYAGFRRRDEPAPAALAALSLYFHCRVSLGNAAAARGWLGRAARLVDESGLAPLTGWVLLAQAHDCADPEESERRAREAVELARRFDDVDLELSGLSQLGLAVVGSGRVEEGEALLDEAMVASLGGECRSLRTVVYVSCNMLTACGLAARLERAAQWVRASDEFTRRYGSPHLYTRCRVSYGSILLVTGRWAEAERQLTAALESARTAERALYGEALGRLAALRIGQGRLEEAEQLLVGFDDHPATAFATALLRLSRCDAVAAETVVLRGLRALGAPHPGRHPGGAAVVEEASLLELLTVAQLARGALDDARATSERLSALARRTGLGVVDGVAHRAAGRVQDAVGEPGAAFSELERALDVFTGSELPHEVARTHLLLARSANDRERAVHEARTALNGFAQLGAERDADAAAAFLREHGVHVARHGRRDPGVLTRREREVLALLAEGLPNREIAERLFLTRKTVEHHVRSVLRKLGLRSRAEAAAFAARRLERDSASI